MRTELILSVSLQSVILPAIIPSLPKSHPGEGGPSLFSFSLSKKKDAWSQVIGLHVTASLLLVSFFWGGGGGRRGAQLKFLITHSTVCMSNNTNTLKCYRNKHLCYLANFLLSTLDEFYSVNATEQNEKTKLKMKKITASTEAAFEFNIFIN